MNALFDYGESLFIDGEYLDAYNCFLEIAKSKLEDDEIKSDALNMLGNIVGTAAPDLAKYNEFEESLTFYAKALELNPNNKGAILNIITNFGEGHSQHLNLDLFNRAYKSLTASSVIQLNIREEAMLKAKVLIFQRIVSQSEGN